MRSTIPLYNQRIHAPYKIAALVEVLEEQGISSEISLKNTGITPAQIHDASELTSVQQYVTVCNNALHAGALASTPFETGSRLHLSAYGMYGYALMSCLYMRDYFRLGVKFHSLATPTLTIEWSERDGRAVWTFPDELLFHNSREIRRFLLEQQFTQHVTHLQDVFGRPCPPLVAYFSHPAPPHADLYQHYLGCPCEFEHHQSELHYDGAILNQRPHLAHQLSAAVLQQTCDLLVDQAKVYKGMAGEVYQRLLKRPGVFPDMENIAEQLGITTRTLRRKLQLENTSFSAILDDIRYSLASEYLKTTQMTTDDIGLLLGFTEPTNFRRAFKRWSGKTTTQYRASEK